MELIDDGEKRRHLADLWRGWSIFLLLSLTIVPEIVRHRRFRVNGVLYELNAPKGMSDGELTRIISLNMPVGISRMVTGALGTEKLERQLVAPGLDAVGQPLVIELLRSSLIADLRLSATSSTLKVALEAFRGSPYLREALVWKIAELRRMNRISQPHLNEIAAPLAVAIADLRGGTRKEKDNEKRRQMQRIRAQDLRFRINRQNDRE
jgi:hypothetical protein